MIASLSQYLRTNRRHASKPSSEVVTLTGDVEGAFAEAQERAGVDFYLIGDYGRTAQLPDPAFDAASPYNMYYPREGVNDGFADYVEMENRGWNLLARDADFRFVPNTLPGFNNTEAEWATDGQPILERSSEQYREVSKRAAAYATGDPRLVLITSFNEWHEYTSIEPSEGFGDMYLDLTRAVFSEPPTKADISLVPLRFSWDDYVLESSVNPDVPRADARKLTIAVDGIECFDGTGRQVAAYDIGSREQELAFVQGIGAAAQTQDRSWRWFEANRKMTSSLFLPEEVARETQGVVLSARALEDEFEFELQLGDGTPATTAWVDTGWQDVVIRLDGQRTPTPTDVPPTSTAPPTESTPTGNTTASTSMASTENDPSTRTATEGEGFGLLASLLATGAGSAWLLRRESDDSE